MEVSLQIDELRRDCKSFSSTVLLKKKLADESNRRQELKTRLQHLQNDLIKVVMKTVFLTAFVTCIWAMRVKGGVSLRSGIIMRNVMYADWLLEIINQKRNAHTASYESGMEFSVVWFLSSSVWSS